MNKLTKFGGRNFVKLIVASSALTRQADAEANYLVAGIECAVMLAEKSSPPLAPAS